MDINKNASFIKSNVQKIISNHKEEKQKKIKNSSKENKAKKGKIF